MKQLIKSNMKILQILLKNINLILIEKLEEWSISKILSQKDEC